jgi:hypothetical protein
MAAEEAAIPVPGRETWPSKLLAAIQNSVQPAEDYKMPKLDDGINAMRAARETGLEDGVNNSNDDVTRDVRMPNQATVLAHARELQQVVGRRAYAILGAYKAGTLTESFIPSNAVHGLRATSWRTRILMLVVFVLEVVFGAKMAERLAGSADWISWAVGLGIAVVLTVSALAIAGAVHTQQVGMLRGKGGWIALGVAVVAVAFLSIYAWGLGGGAEAKPSTGGITGGRAAGEAVTGGAADKNWALILIYAALLLLFLVAVVLSHLLDLVREEVSRVNDDMGRKGRVLDAEQQRRLCVELLHQCLVLNEQAKIRAGGIVSNYIGGVLMTFPAPLASSWDTSSLEEANFDDPTWVADVEQALARLDGGGEPMPNLRGI